MATQAQGRLIIGGVIFVCGHVQGHRIRLTPPSFDFAFNLGALWQVLNLKVQHPVLLL